MSPGLARGQWSFRGVPPPRVAGKEPRIFHVVPRACAGGSTGPRAVPAKQEEESVQRIEQRQGMRRRAVGIGFSLVAAGWVPMAGAEPSDPSAAVTLSTKPSASAEASTSTVQDEQEIGLEYVLTVEGAVVDAAENGALFHYIHGRGQIIPGLERQLSGMHVGESKEITLHPEEGYGTVDPEAFVEVPKARLPAGVTPSVGVVLQGVGPDGERLQAIINEVKGETVVLDLNHPLAGKTLTFKVKVVDIASAPPS